jgi:GNAT superfamily N-acetyltransferase
MNNLKMIRVKQKIGSSALVFAYVMINIRTKKTGYTETQTVEVTPIIKDELLGTQTLNTEVSVQAPIGEKSNKFIATADAQREVVTIAAGSRMMITANIRDKGIGTFAMNEIIRWMIIRYPNYMVDVIKISRADIPKDEERFRAIEFFKNFGFRFNEDPSSPSEGTIETALCMNLHEHLNRSKVEEIDISKFIRELLRERYVIEETIKNQGRIIQEQKVYRTKTEKDRFVNTLINIMAVMAILFLLFYLR